jgi:nitroreductase
MDVLEAIKGRRSVRSFKGEKNVPEETVEELIDAARWAPSAGNIQPWEFIIVRNPDIKEKLAEAASNQSFLEEAPVVIIVCADENRSSQGYGQRGKTLYCIQDTAAAIQNIHLAAHSLGLGTCWVGAFREQRARWASGCGNSEGGQVHHENCHWQPAFGHSRHDGFRRFGNSIRGRQRNA